MNKEKLVPDWMLERYLLGELPRKKRRQLEKLLDRDPALRAELDKMRLADRQILSQYPPELMIPEILKRAALERPRPSTRRRRLAWAVAPVMALAIFLLLMLPPLIRQRLEPPGNSGSDEYTGIKGDGAFPRPATRLQVYRRNHERSELLQDGSPVRAGDLLQVALIPGGQSHGVLLSIDGAGAVTLHFPEKVEGDTALPAGSRAFLPRSYELDQAPGFERFFFVTSQKPLSAAAILEKARALAVDRGRTMTGNLDLPESFKQFSLLVRK